jgi:PAS domain S-box-containing protein
MLLDFGLGSSAQLTTVLPLIQNLFDYIPDTAFFVKDPQGRYVFVNQSLVERCGVQNKRQLLGRHVREVFPKELAALYATQDEQVARTGRPVLEHLELHWYPKKRMGWCLTTKLPLRDKNRKVVGIVGISRDLRALGESSTIPAELASTVEYLQTHCGDRISPGSLARRAGLPAVRFARLIKRIFRTTPNRLILQTRIAKAAQLLAETKRSIVDIAYECGFYDHSAMTRAFRSATYMTPTEFRRSRSVF